jgi:hypothetical protein
MESTPFLPMLTEPELAAKMKYKPNTLAIWRVKLANGDKTVPNLRAVNVNGSIRYRPEFVQEFIEARTTNEDGVLPEGVRRRRPGPGRPRSVKSQRRRARRQAP